MKKVMGGLLFMLLLSKGGNAETDKTLWENLQRLGNGQKIQVIQMNSLAATGKFMKVSNEDITVEVKKQRIVIPRANIRRVDLIKSRGLHILESAGIGAGVGLIILAGNSSGDEIYSALLALPIITGGSAGAGALLPTHKVVYQRP